MFERIKAYKKLNKMTKFVEGTKIMAELTGDEKMLKEANEALDSTKMLKKEMWRKRKMAVAFIQGYEAIGF